MRIFFVQAKFDNIQHIVFVINRKVQIFMIIENFVSFMQKLSFFTAYINNNSSFPKPLSSKDEELYVQRYLNGDEKAKEILIHHNLRLVAHIVKKYNQADEADDLISVGSLGLIKAINTYKPGFGTQFSTYAARCIENEILMLLRVNKKHKNTVGIDDVIVSNMGDNDLSINDLLYEEDNDVALETENLILGQDLDEILSKHLSKREYEIMCMRYGLKNQPMLTQREVAKKLQISRSYISRLEKKSLETLKRVIKKEDYLL